MKVSKIDYQSSNFSKELYDSLANTGFAIIKNHNIDAQLLENVYASWAEWFALPKEEKEKYKAENGLGYFGFKSENAKGYSAKDLKEFFHLKPERAINNGRNPPHIYIDRNTLNLAASLEHLGLYLLDCIGAEYGKRQNTYLELFTMANYSTTTILRVLHYPPLSNDMEEGAVRAAPHEDINLITILPAASHPGLSVKDVDGNWYLLDVDPGSIVVNVGDMLQELTGGKLKSTTHQVLNPNGHGATVSRYSTPLFIHPHPNTRLSERYTAEEYLNERLKEIGLKK